MQESFSRRRAIAVAGATGLSTLAGCAGAWPPAQPDFPRPASGLAWPNELARKPAASNARFSQRGSNYLLDFHGDPVAARLVVYSDGNHHMALEQAVQAFLLQHPDVVDIFYSTTPPRVPSELIEKGRMQIGNLTLSLQPHVFISPPGVLKVLADKGLLQPSSPMMKSRGQVLLLPKGNPKGIRSVADLGRPGVRLFMSNPRTEQASYVVYKETLQRLAHRQGVALPFLDDSGVDSEKVYYGESIHHREAPEAVARGYADTALIYYHLALRYTRIFPETFELLFLDGNLETAPASPQHVISSVNIALVGDGGSWGARFVKHMLGPDVQKIYESHGLSRAS